MKRRLKIGISGIRGIVGETLSPILIADFASAFGEFVGGGRILIGRDTRNSGEMYENAVSAGLLAVGVQPVITGIQPTPSLQYAVRKTSAAGAIAITASHNSDEWNALKFINSEGLFLNKIANDELLDIYNQPYSNYVEENRIRNELPQNNVFYLHQEKILSCVDVEAIRRKRFKVAVDCCNGVGALYSAAFLETFGCEVFPVFDRWGHGFERPPEPLPEHLSVLAQTVKENGCDIGFAQDPDGDRIALVSNSGTILSVQTSALLIAEHLIHRNKTGSIVLNIQTTKAIELIARKYGIHVFYSPVGEVNVTDRMTSEKAFLGIEGSSGGIIYPEINMARDSYAAMALVLEMMAHRSRNVDSMLEALPRLYTISLKLPCPSAQAGVNALRLLKDAHRSQNPIAVDGVRLDIGNDWVLLRRSNTEPVIRIQAESSDASAAADLAESFRDEMQRFLKN